MRGRIALVLACALVAAGCLAAASASTESAKSLEEQARDRADERLDEPELVGLWGIETPREIEEENTTLRIYLDEEPGDGQAASWAYRFIGEERTGIVVVADTIGIVAEYFTPIDEDTDVGDLPSEVTWEVDSEEAADTLAENESWPEMTKAHAVSWSLEGEENETIWHVEATNGSLFGFGDEVEAAVDAQTGEVLEIERDDGFDPDVDEPQDPPEAEHPSGGCDEAHTSGRVSPIDDVETDEAEVEDDNGRARIEVDYSGAGPLQLELLDDDDEEVWSESMNVAAGGTYNADVHGLDAEDYRLVASTSSGAINVDLSLTLLWGAGGECAQDTDYGPTSNVPDWTAVDRSLGVNTLR